MKAIKTLSVPKVTIKGGSLNLVTRYPLNAPAKVPTNKPRTKAQNPGIPSSGLSQAPPKLFAMTIDTKIAIAPQDKSIPAVKIIKV